MFLVAEKEFVVYMLFCEVLQLEKYSLRLVLTFKVTWKVRDYVCRIILLIKEDIFLID